MGQLPVFFSGPKTPIQTCLIISINKKPMCRFPHLRTPLLRLRANLSVIECLPNCIVIMSLLFSGSWERDFSPWPDTPIAASCNLLRISPTHFYRLSSLDTSRLPNHYGLQSARNMKPPNGTVPFDSSNAEVTGLLLSSTRY